MCKIKRYHYVYRITNIIENKHYYGVRSTSKNKETLPIDDIGIKYFSSSTNIDFINEQKIHPENFKYKIIKIFNNRKEAIKLEIKLHNKFEVGVNKSFYNKAKQTSIGFDTTGNKISDVNEIMRRREYAIKMNKDVIFREKQKLSQRRPEVRKIKSKNSLSMWKKKGFKKKMSIIAKDRCNTKEWREQKSKEVTGLGNGNCSVVLIYDSNKNVKYRVTYSIRKFWKEHKYLPWSALEISIRNKGLPIYKNLSKQRLSYIRNKGLLKYQGWYAIKEQDLEMINNRDNY